MEGTPIEDARPTKGIRYIEGKTELMDVFDKNTLILIGFVNDECPPCAHFDKKYRSIFKMYEDQDVRCYYVDTNNPANDSVKIVFQIEYYPTFCVIHRGTYVGKVIGGNEKKIIGLILEYLSMSKNN